MPRLLTLAALGALTLLALPLPHAVVRAAATPVMAPGPSGGSTPSSSTSPSSGSSTSGSSPLISCFYDKSRSEMVLCSDGKVYPYYDPFTGEQGPLEPPASFDPSKTPMPKQPVQPQQNSAKFLANGPGMSGGGSGRPLRQKKRAVSPTGGTTTGFPQMAQKYAGGTVPSYTGAGTQKYSGSAPAHTGAGVGAQKYSFPPESLANAAAQKYSGSGWSGSGSKSGSVSYGGTKSGTIHGPAGGSYSGSGSKSGSVSYSGSGGKTYKKRQMPPVGAGGPGGPGNIIPDTNPDVVPVSINVPVLVLPDGTMIIIPQNVDPYTFAQNYIGSTGGAIPGGF